MTTALTRDSVVRAALAALEADGLDGLSMRALADRLHVRAASLYWHIRDRDELMEMVANAVLARAVLRRTGRDWERDALAVCASVEESVRAVRDGARLALSTPGSIERSAARVHLSELLTSAGIDRSRADATATMMLGYVVAQAARATRVGEPVKTARVASLAIDTGSRGVTVTAGDQMESLIRIAHDPSAAAPAVVRGETVTVRRLRGGGTGKLELNPALPWRFRVQGPTWNTVLDLSRIDVREVKIDSSAVRVEIFLPRPRGSVPVKVSGGVVGVKLHRPPGVRVAAKVSTGAVKVRLDAYQLGTTVADAHWDSGGDASGRYDLEISGGAVQVVLDDEAAESSRDLTEGPSQPDPEGALRLVLDGIRASVR